MRTGILLSKVDFPLHNLLLYTTYTQRWTPNEAELHHAIYLSTTNVLITLID